MRNSPNHLVCGEGTHCLLPPYHDHRGQPNGAYPAWSKQTTGPAAWGHGCPYAPATLHWRPCNKMQQELFNQEYEYRGTMDLGTTNVHHGLSAPPPPPKAWPARPLRSPCGTAQRLREHCQGRVCGTGGGGGLMGGFPRSLGAQSVASQGLCRHVDPPPPRTPTWGVAGGVQAPLEDTWGGGGLNTVEGVRVVVHSPSAPCPPGTPTRHVATCLHPRSTVIWQGLCSHRVWSPLWGP